MTDTRTVALFHSENWENAVVWLRVRGPAAALGWRVLEGNRWQDGRLVEVWPETVDRADYVLIQREFPRFTDAFEAILARARAAGKPIIYELDDHLLELPRDHPGWHYHSRSRISILRAVMEADAVIVSTPPLAESLQLFNPCVQVWPNCWDESLWPLTAPSASQPDRPVVVGYVGTHTHAADVAPLGPVLARLLTRHAGRMRVRFLGGTPPPPEVRGWPQVEVRTFARLVYAEYAQFMRAERLDVALAPLRDDAFNHCKSAIKYIEYTALGAAGVYSRLPPYAAMVVSGQTGWLADDPSEWEAALETLITKPEQCLALARAAQSDLQARWRLVERARDWAALLIAVTRREPGPGPAALQRAERWMNEITAEQEERAAEAQIPSASGAGWRRQLQRWLGYDR